MLVGLTGGVASGKSLVAGEFKRLGAHVIDADVMAREVVSAGGPVMREITEAFGPEFQNPDGTLRRAELGRAVFSDPEKLKRLNKITHPPIRKRIEEEVARLKALHPEGIIVVDAALLIENRLHERMDRVVVVYATEADQARRLAERSGLAADEALLRIRSQMPLSEKTAFGDFVIDNTGEPERTLEAARTVYDELTRDAGDKRA